MKKKKKGRKKEGNMYNANVFFHLDQRPVRRS
jgi:hypothetical protein